MQRHDSNDEGWPKAGMAERRAFRRLRYAAARLKRLLLRVLAPLLQLLLNDEAFRLRYAAARLKRHDEQAMHTCGTTMFWFLASID